MFQRLTGEVNASQQVQQPLTAPAVQQPMTPQQPKYIRPLIPATA